MNLGSNSRYRTTKVIFGTDEGFNNNRIIHSNLHWRSQIPSPFKGTFQLTVRGKIFEIVCLIPEEMENSWNYWNFNGFEAPAFGKHLWPHRAQSAYVIRAHFSACFSYIQPISAQREGVRLWYAIDSYTHFSPFFNTLSIPSSSFFGFNLVLSQKRRIVVFFFSFRYSFRRDSWCRPDPSSEIHPQSTR